MAEQVGTGGRKPPIPTGMIAHLPIPRNGNFGHSDRGIFPGAAGGFRAAAAGTEKEEEGVIP